MVVSVMYGAAFRVAHGGLLDGLLADSFAAMIEVGMASLERVAQDGVRVRAAAGAASFRRQARLLELRRAAAERVAELRAELETDPAAASRRQAVARERAARERGERIAAALAAVDRLKTRADARASTTDADARVMKMADGGFRPAYNLQLASDTKSGMIAAVSLDNGGSDMGKMAPMADRLAAAYGSRPGEHLADGGYASLADIAALDAAARPPTCRCRSPRTRAATVISRALTTARRCRLAPAHGRRASARDLQGAGGDGGVRQRPGPQPRPAPAPGPGLGQGHGDCPVVRAGAQHDAHPGAHQRPR